MLDEIVSLVDVDFAEYRRKNDLRTVKKNCTIPSWLNFEAEKAGGEFFRHLANSTKKRIAHYRKIRGGMVYNCSAFCLSLHPVVADPPANQLSSFIICLYNSVATSLPPKLW